MDTFGAGYGTLPAYSDVVPLKKKQPGAYIRYSIPIPTDEPVLALELAVKPSGAGEMWASFLRVVGNEITFWLADGVPGRNYEIEIKAQLESLQSPRWLYSILCAPNLSRYPLPPEPCPTFGPPISWTKEQAMQGQYPFGPVVNLPELPIAATGTDQGSAANMLTLANMAVTSGSPGGVLLAVDPSLWNGASPKTYNATTGSGAGPIKLYPFSGRQFVGLSVNDPTTLQVGQTVSQILQANGTIFLGN